MKHTYSVIGLGVFGSTIALELSRLGHDVIGIDLNPNLVSEIADRITQAVIADARDEKVLRDLGVHECDGVVVAIGEDIEANILATLIVKGMPKPQVWAKALNPNHHRILEKLGTDHIVHPEHEMGLRLARGMIYPEVMDYISLGHEQFTVEVRASERLAGQKMDALHLLENDLQCLLIKHQNKVMAPPPQQYVFQLNDKILLLGTLGNLRKITKYL
ncbi:TrkA family potassium uptake protein [Nitrosospira sp. NpAV]|uniref:potassium channel family protein n=1 Tax=Nitrosospira sp. NpAV TaxID=58133 RepID=UPI0005A10340|nr:TrkA family potassium uptake protein [Nitrosospira sp. NpAV]KIO48165.1 portal protein [Nitrosospira sp. NpAV]